MTPSHPIFFKSYLRRFILPYKDQPVGLIPGDSYESALPFDAHGEWFEQNAVWQGLSAMHSVLD